MSTTPHSSDPSLAVDAHGRAVIGWTVGVRGGDNEVRVRRLQAGTWTDLPGLNVPNSQNGQIAVTIGQNDEPLAAWSVGRVSPDPSAVVPARARVSAWNGARWEELGGADEGIGRSSHFPTVAASKDGRIAVVFYRDAGGESPVLRVRQWENGAWTTLPSPVSGSHVEINLGAPVAAFDTQGDLVVVWSAEHSGGSSIFAGRWDGKSWAAYGASVTGRGLSATTGESTHPSLGIGPTGPLVAWVHREDKRFVNRSAYVRRWTGVAWEELGGSASGRGVSNADVTTVSLSTDRNGQPVVARNEGDENAQDVFVSAWSGTAWVDASGFGGRRISAPSTFSVQPKIALRAGTTCIAWALYNGDQVMARCVQP